MPLRGKAKKVMESMKDTYGGDDAESVFYATANKQGRTPETWEKKKAMTNAADPLPARAPKAPAPKTPLPAPARKVAATLSRLFAPGRVPTPAPTAPAPTATSPEGGGTMTRALSSPFAPPPRPAPPPPRPAAPPSMPTATSPKELLAPPPPSMPAAPQPAPARKVALARLGKAAADALEGGTADGMPDSAFDPMQLAEGIQTEMGEHTNQPAVAKEIAKDHLAEEQMPPQEQEYYTELEEMEEDLQTRGDPVREQLVAQNLVKMARAGIAELGDRVKTAMSKKVALPGEGYNSLPNTEIPGGGGGGGGVPTPSTAPKPTPTPGFLDQADSTIRSGMDAVGDAVGNLHAGTGDWIKSNPYLSGGIGLAGAGLGAYGLYKLLSKKKKQKRASEGVDLDMLGLKVAAVLGTDPGAAAPPPADPMQAGAQQASAQDLTMTPQQGPVNSIPGVEPPQKLVPSSAGPVGGQPSAGTPNPATGAAPAPAPAPAQPPAPAPAVPGM